VNLQVILWIRNPICGLPQNVLLILKAIKEFPQNVFCFVFFSIKHFESRHNEWRFANKKCILRSKSKNNNKLSLPLRDGNLHYRKKSHETDRDAEL